MAASDMTVRSDISMLKGNAFYSFLESAFSNDIKELVRLQGFSSARSLLQCNLQLLNVINIESDDNNLIAIKQIAAFRLADGKWMVKPGIQYDVDCLMSTLHWDIEQQTSYPFDGSIVVSSELLRRFPWLKALIHFCESSPSSENRTDLGCLFHFIENISDNLMKPPNRNRYSNQVEQFAFILSILGGRRVYEFIRLNLPGSLPSLSTLAIRFDENRENLVEGRFRFESMRSYFKSINVKYAFVSEDCTGIIKKVSYDRQSNSFVGFCPELQSDGFPRVSSFKFESFHDLENAFKNHRLSSLLNIYAIQPIAPHGQRSSPFLLSAYGTDNKFDTYHLINRWLKIFDESLERGIRIVGFSTDCDARYLRTMRLAMNFFTSLPNWDLRQRPDIFRVEVPASWNWFYLDPRQLFVVFQVKLLTVLLLEETIESINKDIDSSFTVMIT